MDALTGLVSTRIPTQRYVISDVSYRLVRDTQSAIYIRDPQSAAGYIKERLRDLLHEEAWMLAINAANRLIAAVRISSGTLNASLMHPRECFRTAILLTAASVIFAHNHPSGNPEPSSEDIALTRQLVESGRILAIPVQDHLIIAGDTYTSLQERGLM